MDEKEHKKRRRSMRTLRRTSGVLPINLLTLDLATENENNEGKPVEDEGSTLGSIWFASDSPKKERRKRRSNIFSILPIQVINENEDEGQNIPTVDEVLTNDAKPVDNTKNDKNMENEILDNEPAILEKISENVHVPTTDTKIHRHRNSNEKDPMSASSASSESLKVKSNSADNLVNVEAQPSDNVHVPPYTPACSDKDGRFDISVNSGTGITPPDLDVSKHSHSSMSPEYPMISPVPAEYANTMSHHESYIEGGESSIILFPGQNHEPSDLSLSDKENSVLANINISDVKECTSPPNQTEKELSVNVSPGFLSVCKTFAGKVVNFVKTSPSYLTSTLLNKTDTTDVSASPALKMNNDVVVNCVKTGNDKSVLTDKNQPLNKYIDLESECPVGSSITGIGSVVLPEKLSEDTNNVPVTPLSLTESARKKRDRERQLILDTFNAIYTEELNKDSERDQSVKKSKQDLSDAGETSISTKDETVLKKFSDSVGNDEINEFEHDCVASKSARVDDNSKQTVDVLESSRGKIVDEKTSSIQGETDVLTPDLTEAGINACPRSNKSSERKRKRRALDVAFVDKNEFETNENNDNNLIENRSEDLVSEDKTVAFNADKNHPVSEKEPDMSSKRSEPPVPRLSLNKVLSNETSSSKCRIDADSSLENGSFKKNGRRRAFGFIGKLKDKPKSATGNSKTDVRPECGDKLVSNALDIEVDIVKSKLPRSGENKMSEIVRVKDNQIKSDINSTASIELTSAESMGSQSETSYDVTQSKLAISVDKINELKKKVQKPKNTRKRISGNFNNVSKNKPKYQLCVTVSGDNGEVGKNLDGVDRNLRSELPGGASSAEHVLSIQNECDSDNLDLNNREGQTGGIAIPVNDDTSSNSSSKLEININAVTEDDVNSKEINADKTSLINKFTQEKKNRNIATRETNSGGNRATNEIKVKNMKTKPDYSQFVKSLTKTPVANKTEKLRAKTPVANKTEKFGAKTPVANKTEKLGVKTPVGNKTEKLMAKTPVANKIEKLMAKTPVANKTEKFGTKTPVANKTEKLGTRTPVISKTEKLEAKTHVANKTEKLVAKTPVANKTEKLGVKTPVTNKMEKLMAKTPVTNKMEKLMAKTPVASKTEKLMAKTPVANKTEKLMAKTPVANKIEKLGTKTPVANKTEKLVAAKTPVSKIEKFRTKTPIGDKNETEKGNKESKKPVGKKCIDFVKLNIDKHKQATHEKDSSEKLVVPIAKTNQSEVTIQNNDNSAASVEKRAIVTSYAKKEQKKSGRRKSGNASAVLNVEKTVSDVEEVSVPKHQNQVDSIAIPDIGLDKNEVNSNKEGLQISTNDVSASLKNDKKVTEELEKAKNEFAFNLEQTLNCAEESKTKLNDNKEQPKKSGRRKSADIASLNVYKNQIKELERTESQNIAEVAIFINNEHGEVNVTESQIELNVANIEPKKRGRPKLTNAASSTVQKDENNDLIIPQHSNIAETDAATDIEQKVESVDKRVDLQGGVNPPKKRGRRKSADAASLSIKKNFAVEHDSSINQSITELDSVSEQNMDNVIDVFTELKEGMSQPKKRGRPKSVDTASLSKNPEISENSNIAETSSSGEQNMSDGKTAVKKRGRRKSADAATLNLKLCVEDSVDIELDAETASNVQATGKRQRRKSADSASLKLQLLSETDIYDESALCSSDMKKGKKRKFETLEEIELLYRNKNYVKPEEKKPWQTIVESPTAPSEIFKKQRLYRFIDHEHPSQMKLRRRAQKALKNGWNPKKRKHVELSDDFVKQKLASLWSELDDQSDDLANKLKSIIDTE